MIFKENCVLGISGCLSGLCQHCLHQHQALARWDSRAISSYSWAQTQSWSCCLTFIKLLPLPLAFRLAFSPLSPTMCTLQGTAAPKSHRHSALPSWLLFNPQTCPCLPRHSRATQLMQFPCAILTGFYCIPIALTRSTAK